MKNLFIIMLFLGNMNITKAADSGINPEYLEIKFYKLAVSTSPYCTNLQTIITEPQGELFDFLSNPVMGSGTVALGTYPCIVIEFSDNIKYAADQNSSSGNCVASAPLAEEICGGQPDAIKYIDGTTSTCVDGQEQKIALYLSTASTNTNGNGDSPFLPPSIGNLDRGLNLGGALQIGQGLSAKFIVNALGSIADSNGSCKMTNPPLFSFEKIIN
jgi:hypothetical protein